MRTHQRRIGAKPFSGQRFVENGRVKVLWYAKGVPVERVIAKTVNAKTLKAADDMLLRSLERARAMKSGAAEEQAPPAEITLGDLLRRHLEDAKRRKSSRTGQKLRPATIRLFGEHQAILERELAEHLDQPAASLRRPIVRAMIQRLSDTLADKTVATIVDYLGQVYRWACSEVEVLESNPIQGVKVPSRKGEGKAYTAAEALAILAAARAERKNRKDWRIRLLVELEAAYGARSMQVIGLRWPEVRFDEVYEAKVEGKAVRLEGVILLRQDATGSKGQPDRTLPMLPTVRDALLAAWNRRASDDGYVLWNWQDSTRHVTYQAMNTSLKRLETLAKVKHIGGRAFHAFRREIGTALAGAVGAKAAADLIGDTIAVTMKSYVKPTKEHQAAAALYLMDRGQPGLNPDSESEGETGSAESATA